MDLGGKPNIFGNTHMFYIVFSLHLGDIIMASQRDPPE